METIPEISGYRSRMPTKFESDFIILGAPILKTNCSSHSIGVRNNLLNMLPHVMQRVWISAHAGGTHNRGNLFITQETIGNFRRGGGG
eukprot:scaffold14270_cov113-Cylindrotheca_fusiformis.AAC.1